MKRNEFAVNLLFDNHEQALLEIIADFLFDKHIILDQDFAGVKDPIEAGKSELHIRMAQAAMVEYKKTLLEVEDENSNDRTSR